MNSVKPCVARIRQRRIIIYYTAFFLFTQQNERAFYYFLSPKEANHRLGYRTYFGMGSVPAWKFTQKLAGMVWGGLGAVLTLVAIIVCIVLGSREPAHAMSGALTMLIIEAVCALLAFLAVEILVFIRYDMNGNLKNKKR